MVSQTEQLPHKLTLNDRKNLTLTGVTEIVSFDDTAIILQTHLGKNNMVLRTTPFTKYEVNKPLKFYVNYDHIVFFDAVTEEIIEE